MSGCGPRGECPAKHGCGCYRSDSHNWFLLGMIAIIVFMIVGMLYSVGALAGSGMTSDFRKSVCGLQKSQYETFFDMKQRGMSPRDLLDSPPVAMPMTGEQQMEIRQMIRDVYSWTGPREQFLEIRYQKCMGTYVPRPEDERC